jgi:pimeloyl-ACP methyl ester carboxylesterase
MRPPTPAAARISAATAAQAGEALLAYLIPAHRACPRAACDCADDDEAMLVLLHGGLWEDMDARRFWERPGIVQGLISRGLEVLAPDRLRSPASWAEEVEYLLGVLPDRPATVVGGSNGCSVAARLALEHPGRVERLLLAWPATAGDVAVDARTRADMTERGAPPKTVECLLAGQTLRGVSDAELVRLLRPVGVLASVPDSPFHQRRTVDALLQLVPAAFELPGCPEPPRPEFPPSAESFIDTVAALAGGEHDSSTG